MSGEFQHEVWLHLAKRLPMGRTARYPHKGDRTQRTNLIVGHDAAKYWCYCQSCKRGAVVDKTHVSIVGARAPAESTRLDLPKDRTLLTDLDEFSKDTLAGFLASKNVDALMLPPLWFSESRKRLLLDTGQGWLGRDTTETSMQKWLSFDGAMYLGHNTGADVAVAVEDPLSYYKIKWAMRSVPGFDVYCALGTTVKPVLALKIASYTRAVMFFDGDPPGWRESKLMARKLRGLGCKAIARCAPEGFDPKDMTATNIRSHLHEAITVGT